MDLEISLSQQFFYYDRFSELNFASFDAAAGVAYYLPQLHNLRLRARYDFNRLTDDKFNEFFVNHAFILSGELLLFPISLAQQRFGFEGWVDEINKTQVAIGVNTEFSFASNPDSSRRNDYSFYVRYSQKLGSHEKGTPFWWIGATAQFAIRDYYVGNRTDESEILNLSANYWVRQGVKQDWTLSFLSSLAWNQSNQSVFNYRVANVGGGVALTVQF